MLMMSPGESPMMIFGTPMFKGNYVIHDLAKNRIGFVPHIGSSKGAPMPGEVPELKLGGVS